MITPLLAAAPLMLDVATFAGFLVLAVATFLLFNFLLGGRVKPVAVGESGVEISGVKKAGPLKRALAGSWPLQWKRDTEGIERDLMRAGHYGASASDDYFAVRNFAVWFVLLGFAGLAVFAAGADPGSSWPAWILVVGFVIAILCFALPRIALGGQAKSRVARIERGLPDALDMIQMCLTGGLPLSEAFARVADEIRHSHPDIAVEFEIIRHQADAGSMARALRNFADRIDAPDVNALSALVTQTERMGTEVSSAISEFGDRMRLTYRQRAEERASKASVWLLLPIILCLVPALLIAIAGPPALRLRNFLVEANQPGGALDIEGYQSNLPNPQDIDAARGAGN